MYYKVVEIFDSIEGEGKRAGQTATFVRFAGCNLNCTYCDTAYANEGTYEIMPFEDIMQRINKKKLMRVTLTGGEPLLVPEIEVLIYELLTAGIEVNIETNGSVDVSTVFNYLQSKAYDPVWRLFFTMDYKLPASGMEDKMLLTNFKKLRPWDVLKFVVGSDDDILHMINFVRELTSTPQIYVGAVHGQYEQQKIVTSLLNEPILKNAVLQVQLHKIIWNPNMRGV